MERRELLLIVTRFVRKKKQFENELDYVVLAVSKLVHPKLYVQ